MPDAALPEDDFDRLLAAHLDDALSPADAARFHERVRDDATARRLLLAAATQASALPRLGLEAAVPRQLARPRRHVWWWPLAAAASLMIAVALWRSSAPVMAVRLAGTTGEVHRDGNRLATATTLQVGDRLDSTSGQVALTWPDEATRIELMAGSRLHLDQLGARKVLRLTQGALHAIVQQQTADGGLEIITPHGRIAVVGTRFDVQVQEHTSRIAVTQGSVRVVPVSGGTPVMLAAGYATEVTAMAASAPGPATEVPASPAAMPATPSQVRITAREFHRGGEGDVVGELVRGVLVDGRVKRITTPLKRPDGWVRLGERLRSTVRVHVDRPTTLALLLVCDQPAGGHAWIGNLQAERVLAAGTHDLTVTRSDLRLTAGAPVPSGSRVVAAAVMCWSPAADLKLEWLEFAE